MLELHKRRSRPPTPALRNANGAGRGPRPLPGSAERERVTREIDAVDRQIDEIVYGLYGITEEERKIIESGGGRG
ncbi:MAG: hypothetical protein QXT68_04150 [Halobacteria archaeon]